MRFGIWLFIHLLGMTLWLGGLLTLGVWTVAARRTGDSTVVAFVYSTARKLYKGVVTSGAILTLVGGVLLMVETGRPWFRPFPDHWLFQMQILGILAFVVTLLYLVPSSGALAAMAAQRAAAGEDASESFTVRVKRQGMVASLVGVVLIYVLLLGGLRF